MTLTLVPFEIFWPFFKRMSTAVLIFQVAIIIKIRIRIRIKIEKWHIKNVGQNFYLLFEVLEYLCCQIKSKAHVET